VDFPQYTHVDVSVERLADCAGYSTRNGKGGTGGSRLRNATIH
jgi:hypothetical protein